MSMFGFGKDPAVDKYDNMSDDDFLSSLDGDDNDADFDIDMSGADIDSNKVRIPSTVLGINTEGLDKLGTKAVGSGAKAVASKVQDAMPEAQTVVDAAGDLKNGLEYLRDDVVSEVGTALNQAKVKAKAFVRATTWLPESISSGIQNLLGEDAETERDISAASKDKQRKALEDSTMAAIFGQLPGAQVTGGTGATPAAAVKQEAKEDAEADAKAQTKAAKRVKAAKMQHLQERKEDLVNNAIRDSVSNMYQDQQAKLLATISNQEVFHTQFTRGLYTSYLRKDLELKFRYLYIFTDTLEAIKVFAQSTEKELAAIRHNTALPDYDKYNNAEVVKKQALNVLFEGIGERARKWATKITDHAKKQIISNAKFGISTFGDVLGAMAENAQMDGGSDRAKFLGMVGSGLGTLAGKMLGGTILNRIPSEIKTKINNYSSSVVPALMQYSQNYRNKDNMLGAIARFFLPDERIGTLSVADERARELNKGTAITKRFVMTVEQIIPSYLSLQTSLLQRIAKVNNNSKEFDKVTANTLRWDWDTGKLVTQKRLIHKIRDEALGTKEQHARVIEELSKDIANYSKTDETIVGAPYEALDDNHIRYGVGRVFDNLAASQKVTIFTLTEARAFRALQKKMEDTTIPTNPKALEEYRNSCFNVEREDMNMGKVFGDNDFSDASVQNGTLPAKIFLKIAFRNIPTEHILPIAKAIADICITYDDKGKEKGTITLSRIARKFNQMAVSYNSNLNRAILRHIDELGNTNALEEADLISVERGTISSSDEYNDYSQTADLTDNEIALQTSEGKEELKKQITDKEKSDKADKFIEGLIRGDFDNDTRTDNRVSKYTKTSYDAYNKIVDSIREHTMKPIVTLTDMLQQVLGVDSKKLSEAIDGVRDGDSYFDGAKKALSSIVWGSEAAELRKKSDADTEQLYNAAFDGYLKHNGLTDKIHKLFVNKQGKRYGLKDLKALHSSISSINKFDDIATLFHDWIYFLNDDSETAISLRNLITGHYKEATNGNNVFSVITAAIGKKYEQLFEKDTEAQNKFDAELRSKFTVSDPTAEDPNHTKLEVTDDKFKSVFGDDAASKMIQWRIYKTLKDDKGNSKYGDITGVVSPKAVEEVIAKTKEKLTNLVKATEEAYQFAIKAKQAAAEKKSAEQAAKTTAEQTVSNATTNPNGVDTEPASTSNQSTTEGSDQKASTSPNQSEDKNQTSDKTQNAEGGAIRIRYHAEGGGFTPNHSGMYNEETKIGEADVVGEHGPEIVAQVSDDDAIAVPLNQNDKTKDAMALVLDYLTTGRVHKKPSATARRMVDALMAQRGTISGIPEDSTSTADRAKSVADGIISDYIKQPTSSTESVSATSIKPKKLSQHSILTRLLEVNEAQLVIQSSLFNLIASQGFGIIGVPSLIRRIFSKIKFPGMQAISAITGAIKDAFTGNFRGAVNRIKDYVKLNSNGRLRKYVNEKYTAVKDKARSAVDTARFKLNEAKIEATEKYKRAKRRARAYAKVYGNKIRNSGIIDKTRGIYYDTTDVFSTLYRDKYFDVYVLPEDGEPLGDPLVTANQFMDGKVFTSPDLKTIVPTPLDITGPVYDETGNILITQEQFDRGLVRVDGKPFLTRASRAARRINRTAHAVRDFTLSSPRAMYNTVVNAVTSRLRKFVDIYVRGEQLPRVTKAQQEAGLVATLNADGTFSPLLSSFNIKSPVFWTDNPANGDKAKQCVITLDELDKLVDADGKSLNVFSRIIGDRARRVGDTVFGFLEDKARAVGNGLDLTLAALKWVGKQLLQKKNPYIDVYVLDEQYKVPVGKPRLSGIKLREGAYYLLDGTLLTSAYDITQPVYDKADPKTLLITEDEIRDKKVVDVEGNPLTPFAGKSLLGKSIAVGGALLGKTFKGAKSLAKFAYGAAKGVASRLLAGGSDVLSNFQNTMSSLFKDFTSFFAGGATRDDLEEVIGTRLDYISAILVKRYGTPTIHSVAEIKKGGKIHRTATSSKVEEKEPEELASSKQKKKLFNFPNLSGFSFSNLRDKVKDFYSEDDTLSQAANGIKRTKNKVKDAVKDKISDITNSELFSKLTGKKQEPREGSYEDYKKDAEARAKKEAEEEAKATGERRHSEILEALRNGTKDRSKLFGILTPILGGLWAVTKSMFRTVTGGFKLVGTVAKGVFSVSKLVGKLLKFTVGIGGKLLALLAGGLASGLGKGLGKGLSAGKDVLSTVGRGTVKAGKTAGGVLSKIAGTALNAGGSILNAVKRNPKLSASLAALGLGGYMLSGDDDEEEIDTEKDNAYRNMLRGMPEEDFTSEDIDNLDEQYRQNLLTKAGLNNPNRDEELKRRARLQSISTGRPVDEIYQELKAQDDARREAIMSESPYARRAAQEAARGMYVPEGTKSIWELSEVHDEPMLVDQEEQEPSSAALSTIAPGLEIPSTHADTDSGLLEDYHQKNEEDHRSTSDKLMGAGVGLATTYAADKATEAVMDRVHGRRSLPSPTSKIANSTSKIAEAAKNSNTLKSVSAAAGKLTGGNKVAAVGAKVAAKTAKLGAKTVMRYIGGPITMVIMGAAETAYYRNVYSEDEKIAQQNFFELYGGGEDDAPPQYGKVIDDYRREWRKRRHHHYGIKDDKHAKTIFEMELRLLESIDDGEPSFTDSELDGYARLFGLITGEPEDYKKRLAYMRGWTTGRFEPVFRIYVETIRAFSKNEFENGTINHAKPGEFPDASYIGRPDGYNVSTGEEAEARSIDGKDIAEANGSSMFSNITNTAANMIFDAARFMPLGGLTDMVRPAIGSNDAERAHAAAKRRTATINPITTTLSDIVSIFSDDAANGMKRKGDLDSCIPAKDRDTLRRDAERAFEDAIAEFFATNPLSALFPSPTADDYEATAGGTKKASDRTEQYAPDVHEFERGPVKFDDKPNTTPEVEELKKKPKRKVVYDYGGYAYSVPADDVDSDDNNHIGDLNSTQGDTSSKNRTDKGQGGSTWLEKYAQISGRKVSRTFAGQGGGYGTPVDVDLSGLTAANIPDGGVGDLGAYVKQFESGPKGSAAIGYDSTGGTSYGTYQLASKKGTLAEFLKFAPTVGEFGKRLAADMGKAGTFNTGSTKGAAVDVWKQYASVDGGTALHKLEVPFIKMTHYDLAFAKIKDADARRLIESDRGLQEALWSTSIQHGSGGAASVFNKTYRPGMSAEDWLRAIYAERGTRFTSSTAQVQASVKKRFKQELPIVLGLSRTSEPVSESETNTENDTKETASDSKLQQSTTASTSPAEVSTSSTPTSTPTGSATVGQASVSHTPTTTSTSGNGATASVSGNSTATDDGSRRNNRYESLSVGGSPTGYLKPGAYAVDYSAVGTGTESVKSSLVDTRDTAVESAPVSSTKTTTNTQANSYSKELASIVEVLEQILDVLTSNAKTPTVNAASGVDVSPIVDALVSAFTEGSPLINAFKSALSMNQTGNDSSTLTSRRPRDTVVRMRTPINVSKAPV